MDRSTVPSASEFQAAMRTLNDHIRQMLENPAFQPSLDAPARRVLLHFAEEFAQQTTRRHAHKPRAIVNRIAALTIAEMLAIIDGPTAPNPFRDPTLHSRYQLQQTFLKTACGSSHPHRAEPKPSAHSGGLA
jgi:hypothetical protein